jgi:type VI secretion system secreted protein Hcp
MAVDYFLKVPDIPGPSEVAGHKGEIEVLGFSWGVTQTGTFASSGGGGAGKADFEELLVAARASMASPKLWLACASGEHIESAVLTCRRSGKPPVDFLKLTLSDVLIASYTIDADEEPPLDQISLRYAKIAMEFRPVDKSGKPKPPIKSGWDVKANQKA